VVVVCAVACIQPTPPPPALPSGTGVQFLQDAGGTFDTSTGQYSPLMNRYVFRNGSLSAPVAAGDSWFLNSPGPLAVAALASIGVPLLPDGTARYPWNGFAGEGVTSSTVTTGIGNAYEVTAPGGTCSLDPYPGFKLLGISPSPDATKLAVLSDDVDVPGGSFTFVDMYAVDSGGCSLLTHVQYINTGGEPNTRPSNPAFIWSPSSTAILYSLTQSATQATSVVRLEATSGSAPTAVAGIASGCVVTGWSGADRVLLDCIPTGQAASSKIESQPLAGGSPRVLDNLNAPSVPTTSTASLGAYHVGYYVPGTTTLVYNSGSKRVTNSDGDTFAQIRARIVADVSGSVSGSLTGTSPPVIWHTDSTSDGTATTQVPTMQLVERFTH